MSDESSTPARVRWARLRFQIIGQLLATPPEIGRARRAHRRAGGKSLAAPQHGRGGAISAKAIERWFDARRNAQDPIRALERKVPKHAGMHPSVRRPSRKRFGACDVSTALELQADLRQPGGDRAAKPRSWQAARLRLGSPLHEGPRPGQGRGCAPRARRRLCRASDGRSRWPTCTRSGTSTFTRLDVASCSRMASDRSPCCSAARQSFPAVLPRAVVPDSENTSRWCMASVRRSRSVACRAPS